ncbi:MAG: hypothetical protein KAJ18_11275 [Candidatus Omnitrophica bacterium]|nr:hypothetical protein [Candidatus Omnitrophota bacterium]
MSKLTNSKHPAYNLRPNKAIDRAIFIELLRSFGYLNSLKDHVYIGLGGPYLEDFCLMANEFPKMQLFTVESDEETFKRQRFHQCSRDVSFYHGEFEDFLSSEFPSDRPTLTWIDYTNFNRKSLLEISSVVRTAVESSIVRVTVNAETPLPPYLRDLRRRHEDVPKNYKKKFLKFVEGQKRRFNLQGVSYPEDIFTWKNFGQNEYPDLAARLVHSVFAASCTAPKTFLPLHAVKYSDGTIMLSVTGLICLEAERAEYIKHFKSKCEFFSPNADSVDILDIPMLSTKERLHLEDLMPTQKRDGKVAMNRLKYLIEGDDSEDLSLYKFQQYEKYHRVYPYFGKLVP